VLPAFVIAQKDLRLGIRDRSALVFSIVAPFGLAAILGSVLPTDEDVLAGHSYAVVDQDGGPIAETFTTEVLGGFDKEPGTKIVTLDSVSEARRLALDDEIGAAFVIPEGFSDAVTGNQPTGIEILGNSEARLATLIAEAVATSFVEELNAVRLSTATVLSSTGGPVDPAEAAELSERAGQLENPLILKEDPAASKELDGKTQIAVGMAVFFLFFTAQFGVLSLLSERANGTLARLLVAPISRGSIIAGKTLSTFVLGTVSMTVLAIASTFILGADWGDPVNVGLLILASVFAAMGVTSMVGSLAKTDEQAAGYSSIVAVILGVLGGTFFPLSLAPEWLLTLNKTTPHYWVIRGVGDSTVGGGVDEIGPSLVALVAFGGILGAIAWWRARRLVAGP
jgi:ABC-2 type transport system permease protein